MYPVSQTNRQLTTAIVCLQQFVTKLLVQNLLSFVARECEAKTGGFLPHDSVLEV